LRLLDVNHVESGPREGAGEPWRGHVGTTSGLSLVSAPGAPCPCGPPPDDPCRQRKTEPALRQRAHPAVLRCRRLPAPIPAHHHQRLPRLPAAPHLLLPGVDDRAGPVHHRDLRREEPDGLDFALQARVLQHGVEQPGQVGRGRAGTAVQSPVEGDVVAVVGELGPVGLGVTPRPAVGQPGDELAGLLFVLVGHAWRGLLAHACSPLLRPRKRFPSVRMPTLELLTRPASP
jgi:hypothetical protein